MSQFPHLTPGSPLPRSRRTLQSMMDAARETQAAHPRGYPAADFTTSQTEVLIKNTTGAAVKQFGVLGIDGPLIDPADNEPEFRRRVVLKGVAPTTAHYGRFVVLQVPLAAGKIGRAVIAGVTVALLHAADANSQTADIEVGESGHLLAGSGGGSQVLWSADPGESAATVLAVVRIGAVDVGFWAKITAVGDTTGFWKLTETRADGSALTSPRVWDGATGNLPEVAHIDLLPGGMTYNTPVQVYRDVDTNGDLYWWTPGTLRLGQVFPVAMSQTGGSAGTESAACSFTYTVTDLEGNELGTNVTPQKWARPSIGAMVAATAGTAVWISGPALQIYWTNEVPDPAACA